jgi:hypothetical protein
MVQTWNCVCAALKTPQLGSDTSLSCEQNDLDDIMLELEKDANNLLDYMASNGLVVSPKTVFMLLGQIMKEQKNYLTERLISSLELEWTTKNFQTTKNFSE